MGYFDSLNAQQLAAVKCTEGASMVIAGAGSGKTRVLTYRIAWLIQNGCDPFHLLALTFTNKAAREMKSRIAEIIGDSDSRNVAMGTFHSVFAKILRFHADKIGYQKNFTIYDTQDSRSLIKSIITELGLDEKIYKPGLIQHRISGAKNNLISAVDYARDGDLLLADKMSSKPRLHEIYTLYDLRCFKASAMDFDDLLFKTNLLFDEHPQVLHFYQHKFRYILVDEYQDTNQSQYVIVKKLAAVHGNICVVGDDAQSIYSFRGANIQNILNFKHDYPEHFLFKLEQNYRSTRTIVNAANSVIAKNKDQIVKTVWTDNPTGNKIRVVRTLTDNEEGKHVANQIYEIKFNHQARSRDFAILYRTNAQSRSFEEALRKLNLPYRIYGGLSFYQRKEIKDLLAYFRLAANPHDEESLKRIVNYPKRGIGNSTIDKVIVAGNDFQVSPWEVISDQTAYPTDIAPSAKRKLSEFAAMIQSFSVQMEKSDAHELAQHIAKASGIMKELYEDKSPEGVARFENIQALLSGIKEFSETGEEGSTQFLSDFMVDIALLTDADDKKAEDQDTISLMTIHSSKGLEFPYVFVVGMEENLFPSQLALNSRAELEEERRLFYVALTRAEKLVSISYATSRYRWGNLIISEPSRFIDEVDPEFLEFEGQMRGGGGVALGALNKQARMGNATKSIFSSQQRTLKKINVSSQSTLNDPLVDIRVGNNVIHERFGKGKVVGLEGNPPVKATVFFPNAGNKQLLLKFAKLEILE